MLIMLAESRKRRLKLSRHPANAGFYVPNPISRTLLGGTPVDRREFIAAAGSVTAVASASEASEWFMRGGFLDHAVPGVGLTVSGPVRELTLYFDLGVIAALSSVQVISSTGARVP